MRAPHASFSTVGPTSYCEKELLLLDLVIEIDWLESLDFVTDIELLLDELLVWLTEMDELDNVQLTESDDEDFVTLTDFELDERLLLVFVMEIETEDDDFVWLTETLLLVFVTEIEIESDDELFDCAELELEDFVTEIDCELVELLVWLTEMLLLVFVTEIDSEIDELVLVWLTEMQLEDFDPDTELLLLVLEIEIDSELVELLVWLTEIEMLDELFVWLIEMLLDVLVWLMETELELADDLV